MNERELSLVKAIGDELNSAISSLRDEFSKSLELHKKSFNEALLQIKNSVDQLPIEEKTDLEQMVSAAVSSAISAIPAPESPELPDISLMVSEAVSKLPTPEDGKSITADDVKPMLQEMVNAAVATIPKPENGKDFDPDLLNLAVADAVNALPKPTDGRDALNLEVQPSIDPSKNYDRGIFATHNGGLWRSYEKTHGMRGWECLVDGVSGIEISQGDQRQFTLTVNRASGNADTKSFDVPLMLYRGVFKAEQSYLAGDTVTWGGSLWHCDEPTSDKPGEVGSKGWTLAAKRGRDGRDKT
ncbi:phage gp6-like head-tail connector protein [Rahnella inusitata]|uniref:phage gp6-like head-tail connector protein n=1 Tax=Rahnella inusitata TaxID=58169 RepID=UPI001FD1B1D4|nr:phage gp6-like head-tail connector protein [Rahnella inusitata]